ncbi:MAG: RpiB/LacA/LacB family sugar-phosphate isomerase, partial [Chloroflexota bacterium]
MNRVVGSAPRIADRSPAAPPVIPHAKSSRTIYQDDVRAVAEGGELRIAPGARLTPLAQELALQRKIKIVVAPHTHTPTHPHTIAIGADHGGFPLKETLKAYLAELGCKATDVGTHSAESVDYPDFAYAVAKMVADGQAWRGIMVDGAGIGSCMVANKVPGVRASLCYDVSSASNAREHNDANVLT